MKTQLLIFFCFCFLLFSCNSEKKESLSGEISEIEINHVVDKRDGCRFTTLYFTLNFNNNFEQSKIGFTPSPEHCIRNIKESKTWWIIGETKLPLTALPSQSNLIEINKGESKQVKLKGIFKVFGGSLSEIKKHYENELNSDFVIVHENKLTLKKSKSFKLKYVLDDKEVSLNDSLDFNYILPEPNLSDSTEIEVEIIEDVE